MGNNSPTSFGTAFATAGFSFDPNLSPNNQTFAAAVAAIFNRNPPAAGTSFVNIVVTGTATIATLQVTTATIATENVSTATITRLVVGTGTFSQLTASGTATFGAIDVTGTASIASLVLSGVALTQSSGTFTATLSGCTTTPTSQAIYAQIGNLVVIAIAAITGTSNSTSMGITGLPASIQPARAQMLAMPYDFIDNGGLVVGTVAAQMESGSGGIVFFIGGSSTGWGNTLIKGLTTTIVFFYLLN